MTDILEMKLVATPAVSQVVITASPVLKAHRQTNLLEKLPQVGTDTTTDAVQVAHMVKIVAKKLDPIPAAGRAVPMDIIRAEGKGLTPAAGRAASTGIIPEAGKALTPAAGRAVPMDIIRAEGKAPTPTAGRAAPMGIIPETGKAPIPTAGRAAPTDIIPEVGKVPIPTAGRAAPTDIIPEVGKALIPTAGRAAPTGIIPAIDANHSLRILMITVLRTIKQKAGIKRKVVIAPIIPDTRETPVSMMDR